MSPRSSGEDQYSVFFCCHHMCCRLRYLALFVETGRGNTTRRFCLCRTWTHQQVIIDGHLALTRKRIRNRFMPNDNDYSQIP
jgi:hypothetical protein